MQFLCPLLVHQSLKKEHTSLCKRFSCWWGRMLFIVQLMLLSAKAECDRVNDFEAMSLILILRLQYIYMNSRKSSSYVWNSEILHLLTCYN